MPQTRLFDIRFSNRPNHPTFAPAPALVWQCDGKPEAVPPESLYFTLGWQEHGSIWEFEPGHYWYFVVIGTVDKVGRRKLMLLGTGLMAVILFVLAGVFRLIQKIELANQDVAGAGLSSCSPTLPPLPLPLGR